MRLLGLMLVALAVQAQTPGTPPLLRGVILERDAQTAGGQFSVRAADSQVYRFQFDRKTYVERDQQLIDVPRLVPGEKVEVVSDTVAGSVLRYARTVHVLQDVTPPRPQSASRFRANRPSIERNLPTGNLTYSGVVYRLTGERLILHTREQGDQAILLRKDTRYLENGENVDGTTLRPNMRVFVRAGKDLYDQVEAYQVVWGSILDPK